jgi:hypothetical protein
LEPFKHKMWAVEGPTLGPNILAAPNGPYLSAPWTGEELTEETGRPDPVGGNTASRLTDNANNAQHRFYQSVQYVGGQKYLTTVYFQVGTYTDGITITLDGASTVVSVDAFGVPTVRVGSVTNLRVELVGSSFFKVTFNHVGHDQTFFIVNFGSAGATSYAGSGQTQTFWGLSSQTST